MLHESVILGDGPCLGRFPAVVECIEYEVWAGVGYVLTTLVGGAEDGVKEFEEGW